MSHSGEEKPEPEPEPEPEEVAGLTEEEQAAAAQAEAEEQMRRVEAYWDSWAQYERLNAFAVNGHPAEGYNGIYLPAGECGSWPHYRKACPDAPGGYVYLWRHADSERWVFSFATEPVDLEWRATLFSPEGTVPVGACKWKRGLLDTRHKLSRSFGKYPSYDNISVAVLATEVDMEAHAEAARAAQAAKEAAVVEAARALIGRTIKANGGACEFWKLAEVGETYQCDIIAATLRNMKRDGLVLFSPVSLMMPRDHSVIVTQLSDLPILPDMPLPEQQDGAAAVRPGTGLSAGEEPAEQWEPPAVRRKDMLSRMQANVSRLLQWHPPLVFLSAMFGDRLSELEQVGSLGREPESARTAGFSRGKTGEQPGDAHVLAVFRPESVGPRTASPAGTIVSMARASSPAGTLASMSEGADRLPRPMTRGSTTRGSTRDGGQGTRGSSRATSRGNSRPATRKRIDPAIAEQGVALEAILMIAALFDEVITLDTTTADVCNVIIRPLTCPDSHRNNVKVLDVLMDTYSHSYFDKANRIDSSEAPPFSRSWSELLQAHPKTCGWVGPATVFVSHAHSCSFRSFVDSLKQLRLDLPSHAPVPFFWVDFLCTNLHVKQSIPQEWWSTTLKQAIERIGHTVMLLNPWDRPGVLTRSWCLWELYCTVDVNADFSVCLAPNERKAFETAMLKRPRSVLQAFSKIEIEQAKATVAEEQKMILAEVNEQFDDEQGVGHFKNVDGGPEGLNTLVSAELRDKWVIGSAWALVAMQTGQDGELETAEALEVGRKVASLMGIQFGKWTEAKTLWALVADGSDKLSGSNSRNTLQARGQLAQAMRYLNEPSESRALFEDVLQRQKSHLDKNDETSLITRQNFANLLRGCLHDFAAARELEEQVVAGFTKLHGPEHDRTLTARGNYALTLDMEGRYNDAKREYEAVLRAQRHRYGSRHPHVLHTQYNLALLLHNRLGDARGGRQLLQEVLRAGETVLGAGHPQTKRAARTLALWARGW